MASRKNDKIVYAVASVVVTLMVSAGVAVGASVSANSTPIPAVQVPIVEKTTRMATGGFAVGEVNGEQVLVYGDWVAGDIVTAYPQTVDGGTKAQYFTSNPNSAKWVDALLGGLVGFTVAAMMLAAAAVIADRVQARRKARRIAAERESRRIVDAAVSDNWRMYDLH